jgi:acetylornithine deacetylase/succinyl-diaminopimelate desuccinylase-like protein
VDTWTFSTNGVALAGTHGIPCVGFGPGFEEQAHAPDEFCPVEHLVRAAAFYARFPAAYAAAVG